MVADGLRRQAEDAGMTWQVDPAQGLITTDSQQGLDLVAITTCAASVAA